MYKKNLYLDKTLEGGTLEGIITGVIIYVYESKKSDVLCYWILQFWTHDAVIIYFLKYAV